MAGLEIDIKFNKSLTKDLDDSYGVNVGWFQDSKYKDDLPVAQVARWQEFGTKAGIPRRPFMSMTWMAHEKDWEEKLKTIVQRALDEDKDLDKALAKFGEIVKSDIQDMIMSGNFVRNSPITVKGGWIRRKGGKPYYVQGKGFDKPLIDTGVMIASIQGRTDKEMLDNV